jgi:outer membrane lipoprotein-sorting protein
LSTRAIAAIFLLLLLLLSGCAMTGEGLEKNISRKLTKLDSYYAELEAEVFSTEGTQIYKIRQWMQKPGRWRVEVSSESVNQVFICDGEQIVVHQPGLEDYYRLDADDAKGISPPFFLFSYLEQLLEAEELHFAGKRNEDGQKYYLVSFDGPHPDEIVSMRLDTRTLFPMLIESSLNDELLNRISCTLLDLRPEIPDELFTFEGNGEREVASHCLIQPLTLQEAQEIWPQPVYIPTYLPGGSFLFVISRGEENGTEQLVFIYQGESHFTIVQRPRTEATVYKSETTQEIAIGQALGYYHQNKSGELATLWWSNETTHFILTGTLSMEQMMQVATSLQPS